MLVTPSSRTSESQVSVIPYQVHFFSLLTSKGPATCVTKHSIWWGLLISAVHCIIFVLFIIEKEQMQHLSGSLYALHAH